jgi:starch synthase
VPDVFTAHNLAFQGLFPPATLATLGLGWEVFDVQGLEYWGQISYLKGGLNFSERIATVGPAGSVLTPEGGFGFEGVLSRRADALSGLPGGTDDASWDLSAADYVKVYKDAGAGAPAERLTPSATH